MNGHDLLVAAGFTSEPTPDGVFNVRMWNDYSGKRVLQVWHEDHNGWKYLPSWGDEPGPMFDDVSTAITWMKVEGWIA